MSSSLLEMNSTRLSTLLNVTSVTDSSIEVHYYGSTHPDLSRATFRPDWHKPNNDVIHLSTTAPIDTIRYAGVIELDSIRNLLVARNLEMLSSRKLRKKSQNKLFHIYDELFIFDR